MKKAILFPVLVTVLFVFLACPERSVYQYNNEELSENVAAVDLIYYHNRNSKWIDDRSDLLPFDLSKIVFIESLEKDKIKSFCKELSEINIVMSDEMNEWIRDSPDGICIRLLYKSGDFEIISYTVEYYGSFFSNGKVKEFITSTVETENEDIKELINNNFSFKV
jgi:hypothetical protein